jgi:hypothetical protein
MQVETRSRHLPRTQVPGSARLIQLLDFPAIHASTILASALSAQRGGDL